MAKKSKSIVYYEAVGRRKEAVAQVRLYLVSKEKFTLVDGVKVKEGEFLINKKPLEKSFSPWEKELITLPLKLTNNLERFAISVHVRGGGTEGRAEAIRLGIARAIEKSDKETYRPVLKKAKLLVRDARIRERRKVGTGGKARRAKQSPKR